VVFGFGAGEVDDRLFGDQEDVDGGLGGNIAEGEAEVIFVDDISGDFAADDFAEDCIAHSTAELRTDSLYVGPHRVGNGPHSRAMFWEMMIVGCVVRFAQRITQMWGVADNMEEIWLIGVGRVGRCVMIRSNASYVILPNPRSMWAVPTLPPFLFELANAGLNQRQPIVQVAILLIARPRPLQIGQCIILRFFLE
jgi:hypothetical protein